MIVRILNGSQGPQSLPKTIEAYMWIYVREDPVVSCR